MFSHDQKQEIIPRLTETMVDIEGEAMRPVTWVTVEEVNSGEWGAFIAWMKENGLIASEPAPSGVLSNAYLPGKIPE